MNKKTAGALVFSFVLLALPFSTSQAAVKAGDLCKKVGLTSIANGKKFTCIMSGKKIIWNKGVTIPVISPKPTQVPSSPSNVVVTSLSISKKDLRPGDTAVVLVSAASTSGIKEISGTLKSDSIPLLGIALGSLTSGNSFKGDWTISLKIPTNIEKGNYFIETVVTDLSGNSFQTEKLQLVIGLSQSNPTPTSSSLIDRQSQYIYRYQNGVLERKIANRTEFTSVDSRSESEFDLIRVNAYKNIRAGLSGDGSKSSQISFDWAISPNFPTSILNYTKTSIIQSGQYWSEIFKMPLVIPVQFFTEKDKDYLASTDMQFSGLLDILNTFDDPAFKNQVPWMSGGGGYWRFKGIDRALMNFQAPSYSNSELFVSHWPTTGAHEFMHVVQDYFLNPDRSNWTEALSDKQSYAHFREGSANTIGFALGMPNLGWYSDVSDWWVWKYSNQFGNWKPSSTEHDIVNLLIACESKFPTEAHEISYPLGSLLYEWVIGTYGLDSYLALVKNQSKYLDFGDNIQASLHMTKIELYERAAPYILHDWNRAKN